jgi:hypothetical protein
MGLEPIAFKLSRSLSGAEVILLASAPLSQRDSRSANGLSCQEALNLTTLVRNPLIFNLQKSED